MNFRKLVVSATALALLVVVGCSSSSTSSSSSALQCPKVGDKNCPNDQAATQQVVDLCNKCLSQDQAYATCEGATTKAGCGSDGKTVAMMVDPNKCMNELSALTKCFSGM